MASAGAVKIPIPKHFAETLFIGVLMKKEKREKEKKKDNQYKHKKAMAIAIGLNNFYYDNFKSYKTHKSYNNDKGHLLIFFFNIKICKYKDYHLS